MKKSKLKAVVFAFTMLIAMSGYSQVALVQSALSIIKNNDIDMLGVAAKDLNLALKDADTKDDPKMWFARARVFQMIAQSDDTATMEIDPEAGYKSIQAYIAFFKNPSDRSYYTNQANANFPYAVNHLYNMTFDLKDKKQYDKVNSYYDLLREMYKYDEKEILKTALPELSNNKILLYSYYNCLNAGTAYNAKGKAYLLKLVENNYIDANIYGYLADYALQEGDTTGAISYLNEGRELDNTNISLIYQEINLYITLKKDKELLAKVSDGIAQDPQNSQLYFIRGFLYQSSNKMTEAEEDYKKAVEFDPNNFDALQNLGIIFIDQANAKTKKMNDLYANPSAQAKLWEEIKSLYEKGLPYLENVANNKEFVENNEKYNLLKDIRKGYRKLKNKEKVAEYTQKIRAMEE